MRIKSLACICMCISLTFMLNVPTVFSAEYNWNMANEYALNSIVGQADASFAKALEKESNGRIKVTLHQGGSLGYKQNAHFDAVRDGTLDIASTISGVLRGVNPIFEVNGIPFIAKDFDEVRTLHEVAMSQYEEIFAENGQKLLFIEIWLAGGICAKKNITSVADLKNLKIRSYSPNDVITLKELGAAPVSLTWADVVPQISTGGIDAVITSPEGVVLAKLWEFTDYFIRINNSFATNFVHMNADLYKGLPADIKKAVDNAAAVAAETSWNIAAEREKKNIDIAKKNGMKIITDINPDLKNALTNAAQITLDKWLAKTGDNGEKIIQAYKAKIGSK